GAAPRRGGPRRRLGLRAGAVTDVTFATCRRRKVALGPAAAGANGARDGRSSFRRQPQLVAVPALRRGRDRLRPRVPDMARPFGAGPGADLWRAVTGRRTG